MTTDGDKKEFERLYGLTWEGHYYEREQWLKNRIGSNGRQTWDEVGKNISKLLIDKPPTVQTLKMVESKERISKAMSFLRSSDLSILAKSTKLIDIQNTAVFLRKMIDDFELTVGEAASAVNTVLGYYRISNPGMRYINNKREIIAHDTKKIIKGF